MNSLSPFVSVDCASADTLRWASHSLRRAGFRVMQTFDLHAARLGLEDCPCPHHGTSDCDCQMVVLLVYGEAAEPAVLVLHGSDGQTWLSLVQNAGQSANPGFAAAVKGALRAETLPDFQTHDPA